MPTIRLADDAVSLLLQYNWGGNIRQLRNITEQLSVLEQKREVSYNTLKQYLPSVGSNLPAVINRKKPESDFSNEREILYKVLFDMQRDINDLKKLTMELMNSGSTAKVKEQNATLINKIYADDDNREAQLAAFVDEEETPEAHDVEVMNVSQPYDPNKSAKNGDKYHFAEEIEEEESLSIQDKELELIKKSLEKYDGKRKEAAAELGISERTLYRKIKQYNL